MDTQKIKEFIAGLLKEDGKRLKRSIGVGIYLFNLMKEEAPLYLLEKLKSFDGLPYQRRKAILMEVIGFLKTYQGRPTTSPESGVEKKPLRRFLIPLERLKFLSEKELKTLKGLGLESLLDALFFFPVRYEDRRLNTSVKSSKAGQKVALKVRVVRVQRIQEGGYTAEVVCKDETGYLKLKFRYKKVDFLFASMRKGMEIAVFGKLRSYKGEKYMVHPEILRPESGEVGRILPVYYSRVKGELVKISSKQKQKRIREALEKIVEKTVKYMPEYLPQELLEKYSFPRIEESIREVHLSQFTPPALLNNFSSAYHKRFIYEDLLVFQCALLLKKREASQTPAPRIGVSFPLVQEFTARLPFRLTRAQERVVREILKDLASSSPMNRLLQGDVGSGKTVVAAAVAYAVVKAGYQVAVMVPTEILAHQHYEKFKEFLENFGIKVALLTGSKTPAQKRSAYKHIKEGNIDVVVGTHALIQDKVEFKNLGLVVIDEQHRFGVMQRKVLLEKGGGMSPHCLVMSATPIPRTLALSIYGDLDISVIDELPPGRKEVITRLIFESEKDKLFERIRQELDKGNKVYVVYPLIESSEKLELKAATQEYERWKREFLEREVYLLHGRMSEAQKRETMESFRERGDILVSTTVIEVGVDVPEATVMVIEDAHRFGLSQLHQLRGRVGRSDRESLCFLVVPDELKNKDRDAVRRLRVLVKTNDGFAVAEEDLKIRGPGELLGVSQSGYFGFHMANLARSYDREVLKRAREDAQALIERNPTLEGLEDLKSLILHRYGKNMNLSLVA